MSDSDTDNEGPTSKRKNDSDDNLSLHSEDGLDVNKDVHMLTEQSKATGQKEREASASETLFKELANQLDNDQATGDKIKTELAQIAQKHWGKTLAAAKIKFFAEKYKCPDNCTAIKGTKVNREIWTWLNSKKRSTHLNLSNMQQTIHKVIYANLQTTNLLLSNPTGESNSKIF